MSIPPTGNLGMGFAPLGLSLFGFGAPATAGQASGYVLETSPNGASGDARMIDPYTRDYILDSNGLVQGQSAIAQQVFLAIITTLGSAANPTVGSQFSNMKTFSITTYQGQVKGIVQSALAYLIQSGQISLVSVQASINSNGVAGNVTINWIDNTTGQLNTTSILP